MGQNVLYADSHTEFADKPGCGVSGDNIYTWGFSKNHGSGEDDPVKIEAELGDTIVVADDGWSMPGAAPTNYSLDLVSKTDACLLP